MKSILMKLLVLAVCAAMLLSLFACDKTEDPTEAPTSAPETEAPADDKTEAPTQKETEAPTQKETEAPTQNDTEAPTQGTEAPVASESESTQTPSESESAQAPSESESAQAPSESESTQTPSESESAQAPVESDTTGTPTDTEAKPEDKPTETEAKPEDKPTETEAKPEDKPTETEAKPEDKPTETKPEEKPTETEAPKETETEGPKCDGNHPIKAKGDQGHYVDKCDICGTERGTIEDHTYETVDGKPTCKVCGYVASCNGVHEWQSDENGHWTEKCNACDAPATESAAHEMAHNEAGEYRCTVCQYLVTCDKNHALTDKGAEGHEVAACIICNTEAVTVPHVYKDKDGSRFCACGNEAACKGQHNWQSDADGHWADACDVCGAAAVEKTAHDAENSEFMTADALNYGCATCGYAVYTKALTDKVAALITPSNMHYNEANAEKGNLSSSTKYHVATSLEYAGLYYASITHNSTDNISQFLWNRHLGDVVDRSAHEEYTFDIGQAKYLVIKARATMGEASQINLSLSTVGVESYKTVIMPLVKATENAEWVTYVIDIEKAYGAAYAKAEGAETYAVDTFYFHMQPFTTEDTLDIAYMAFVEGEWDSVDAFVEEETVVKVTGSNTGSVVYTETAKCVGDHAYETVVHDGYYQTVCACGDVKFNYGIKADGPNKFFGAERLSGTTGFTGSMDVDLTYEEDAAFVRISNPVVNTDNWYGWDLVKWESGNFGQYMIMKVRIGENGLSQSWLQIYTHSVASKNAGINWPTGNLKFKVTEDNQWHYIVVDLAACVPGNAFQGDADGNYAPNYFQLRPFSNAQSIKVADGQDTDSSKTYTYHYHQKDENGEIIKDDKGNPVTKLKTQTKLTTEEMDEGKYVLASITTAKPDASDYMDISYIAFCDSMDDIKNIVDVDTYEWSVDSATSSQRYTEDNTCVTHAIKETVEGELHTVSCSVCEETLNTFSVPAAINWYSPLGNMVTYNFSIDKMLYDEFEGVLYNRYTGAGGGSHLCITGGAGAGAPTSGTFPTGKYIVIKYRMESTGTISFNIATGDKKSGNGVGIVAPQSPANMPGMEWRVAIIDVSANAQWTSDGSNQSIYMMMTTGTPYTVDIAYVAVVDSIDEMKLLLKEGETYFDLGNSWDGTPVQYNQDGTKVPCLDGKHTATVSQSADENGNTTYSYVCASCDATIQTATVGENVAKYYTPNSLVTDAKQYFSPANNGVKAATGETDLAYAAFNNYRQLIYMRHNKDLGAGQGADASQAGSFSIGNSKYAVIKFRSSDVAAWLTLSLSFAGYDGPTAVAEKDLSGSNYHKPDGTQDTLADGTKGVAAGNEYVKDNGYWGLSLLKTGEADGEWVTAVIDLAKAYGHHYAKAEGAEDYVVDYLVVDLEGAIDIAYLAFVEGEWAEIDALVDEDTVRLVNTTQGGYDTVYTADGALLGTKAEAPLSVMFDENMSASVTVPAKTTFYFSSWSLANGMILKANGEELKFVAGSMMTRTPSTFSITNDTDAPATYALTVEFAKGAFENPAELVEGDNVIEFAEGAQSYYLKWTATESGKITLTFSANTGWYYVVNRTYNGSYPDILDEDGDGDTEELIYDRITAYGDGQWSDSDPLVDVVVIEFEEGDVIEIQVCTYDPANPWAAPAGTVTVNAKFGDEPSVLVVEDLSELNDMEDGTAVQISGTVVIIDTPWSDSFGNITVIIEDEFGNTFKLYRLSTNVVKGDIITATGVLGSYNGAKQLAQGGTAVINGHDTSYDVAASQVTIKEALALADGTDIIVTGTVVKIGTAYNSQYNNISVYIKDENGDELYLYRLAGNVSVGDIITVSGAMATYSGARQVGAGATFEKIGTHECSNYTEADCTNPAKCVVCGAANGEALPHSDVEPADGKCDACGTDLEAAASQVTTTFTLDAASRTSFDAATSAVWETEGVKLTNNKGSYNNNLGDYTAPARIYAGTEVIIECTGMTKIVFHVNSGKPVDGLTGGLTDTAAYTVDVDGYTVTVTFVEPVDSITFSATAQFRLDSMDVTHAA